MSKFQAQEENLPSPEIYPITEQLPLTEIYPITEQSSQPETYPITEQTPTTAIYPITEQLPLKETFPISEQPPIILLMEGDEVCSDVGGCYRYEGGEFWTKPYGPMPAMPVGRLPPIRGKMLMPRFRLPRIPIRFPIPAGI
jgi:hypothetical protein